MRPPELGTRDIGLLALWFASVGGLGTAALLAGAALVLKHYVHSYPEVVWKGPLSYAFLFLPTALLLLLLAGVAPRVRSPRVVITVFAWLTFWGWALGYPRLAPWAGAVLALGLAIRVAGLASDRWSRLRPIVGWTLGGMLLFQAGCGLGLAAWRLRVERKAITALPALSDRPNVLLLVLDTVRAISLSLYGYERPTTPWLTAFARSGVRFDQAISTAPWTLPSHASLMTGRWAHELSANWERPLDTTFPTLAEQLDLKGYVTAGFVANTYYCSRESGLARGFIEYHDFEPLSWETVRVTPLGKLMLDSKRVRRLFGARHKLGRKSGKDINREFLSWLDDQRGHRPFFAFLNYFDAHGPYQPPSPYDSVFGAPSHLVNPELDTRPEAWTPEEVQGQSAAYHASIAALDALLADLMQDLQDRGLLDNTLIIVTADHGEEFLEHGVMTHGNSLFRQAVHVPLVMRLPGRLPPGVVVQTPVSLRDIPVTVMDLAGYPDSHPFPGRSLSRFLPTGREPEGSDTDLVFSSVDHARGLPGAYPVSTGALSSAMVDGFRFIERSDGTGQWYRSTDITERDTVPSDEVPEAVRVRAKAAMRELGNP